MSEYIVNVPDEHAKPFIERFGIEGTQIFGFQLMGEIVRCGDCQHYKETDGLRHFDLAFCKFHNGPCELRGFCAWGERKGGGE